MATPRKAWFRVADSILNEGWPPHVVGMLTLFSAWLNTRWAREGLSAEDACRGRLPIAVVMLITGARRADIAKKRLGLLADVSGMSLTNDGEDLLFSWPKFAEFQGYRTLEKPLPPPPPPPPPLQKSKSPATRGRKRRSPRPPFPADGLSAEQLAGLRDWARDKGYDLDFVVSKVEDIRDWAIGGGEHRADWLAVIRGAIRRDAAGGRNGSSRQGSFRGIGRSQTPIEDALGRIAERRGRRPGPGVPEDPDGGQAVRAVPAAARRGAES